MGPKIRKNKINFIYLLILLLLTTPSFGIIYKISGIHIANDKLGLLLAISMVFFGNIKIWKPSIYIAFLLAFLILLEGSLRALLYKSNILYDQDVSFLAWCFGLPFYLSIFRSIKPDVSLSILSYLGIFHGATFLLGLLLKWFGMSNVENFFIANPIQYDYMYPEVCCNFYRVAGYFNESSQAGIFFVLMYWLFQEKKYAWLYLLLDILTFSMTSYLMACIIIFSKIRYLIYLLILIVVSYLIFPSLIDAIISALVYRSDLVFESILDMNSGEPRVIALSLNFQRVLDNLILGVGASMADMDRWDLISVYILPYGIIGGSIWLASIIYLFKKFNLGIFYYVILLTNATVLSYVTLVALLVGYVRSFTSNSK